MLLFSCDTKSSGSITETLYYTVYGKKLLSGKTFAVGMQMTIHRKTFAVASSLVIVSSMKPMEYLIQQIRGKIFAIGCKIEKTAKVFPLKSFAVYTVKTTKLVTVIRLLLEAYSFNHRPPKNYKTVKSRFWLSHHQCWAVTFNK